MNRLLILILILFLNKTFGFYQEGTAQRRCRSCNFRDRKSQDPVSLKFMIEYPYNKPFRANFFYCAGSTTVTVKLFPSALAAVIFPLWAWVTAWAMDNPMP